MKLFNFMTKCQSVDIQTQYNQYNVRCFDLRIKFKHDGQLIVAHNLIEYSIDEPTLLSHLEWLNNKGDVYVRVIHEIRTEYEHNLKNILMFRQFCTYIQQHYPKLKLWCGRNLANWQIDYQFSCDPSCKELYSSVCSPSIIDDWWPWLYARLHNKKNRQQNYKEDILLVDFVNIGI